MLATRWEPRNLWSEMNRLRDEMDRVFGRYGGDGGQTLLRGQFPPLNIWEDEDHLFVEAELAGLELSDLEIVVTGSNQLSIKGERKQPEVNEGTWHRQERAFGAFSRIIELPEHVDAEKVAAQFKDGVLTITMPKKEEAKPRRIEVKCD